MYPNTISLTPEEMFHLQLRLQQQQGARTVTNDGSDGGGHNAGLIIAPLQSSIFAPAPPARTAIEYAAMYSYPPSAGSVINVQPSMTAYDASLSHTAAQQQLLAPSFSIGGIGLGASDAKFAPTASAVSLGSPSFPSPSRTHLPISASSASDEKIRHLLGIGRKATGKGSRRQKKPKDMPKRPLSAYNLFFKDERQRIVNSKDEPKQNDATDGSATTKSTSSISSSVSTNDKSSRRTPHGKIGFANLARIVGANWKKLSSDRLEHYQRLADKDTDRYKREKEL
jgi:hypothetical protein